MKTLTKSFYKIISLSSGAELSETKDTPPYAFSNPDIDVVYGLEKIKKPFAASSLLPLSPGCSPVSLHEGNTPLIPSRHLKKELNIENLYFKFEGANPTGSFKDRGSAVEIAKALEYRAKGIAVASTGNMAASISAYSAAAGIPCFIFVPFGTPETKLAQTLFYGGKIIQVKGTYDDAAILASQVAQQLNLYLAGDYSFRAEGQKSQSYEIIRQLNNTSPDYVVVPVGNGTNILAIWKGFKEFFALGIISKLPKMIGVQVEGFDSIYKEWSKSSASPNIASTVASAIAVKRPSDKDKVLALVKESQGCLASVSNDVVLPAQIEISRQESLLVEPSSATILPALRALAKQHYFLPGSTVVALATGHGLKDVHAGLSQVSSGIITASTVPEIESIISQDLQNL